VVGAPLLQVDDLQAHVFTKRGVVRAVDGVSFAVGYGETLGLVGESGCGKSMTCLSLVRLLPQPGGRIVGGRILLEGEDLTKKSEAEMRKVRGRRIAIVLQDPLTSLNPALCIGEQVAEVIRLHQGLRGRGVREKVVEALGRLKIPDAAARLRHFPYQMSGGMRQRVVGAIALACEPALLIADEPTTSLDVTIQAQYLELLKELQSRLKFGIVFVTHDFGIVARMCDAVCVMYAGKVVEKAATAELFANPVHPYTVALMDCLPSLDRRLETLALIEGQPPDLVSTPPGCAFAPRCRKKMEICTEKPPVASGLGRSHEVACWRAK